MGDVEADGGCCLETTGQTTERWVYKGPGLGSYSKVGSLQLVGYGKGSFEILGFRGSLEKVFFFKGKNGLLRIWTFFLCTFNKMNSSQSNVLGVERATCHQRNACVIQICESSGYL